jgi:hypothetical protein
VKSTRASFATAVVCAAFLAVPVFAQDKKPAAAPKADAKPAAKGAEKAPEKGQETSKRIFENDKLTVTETTYAPGASSAMRERGDRVSRALTAGTMERTSADGKKQTLDWKAGETKYLPRETFSQKNVGKSDWVVYTVTLKK